MGRHSNPVQRRLSASDLAGLLDGYRAGATIAALAERYGIHRTTVRDHLDRAGVPIRHHRPWTGEILEQAAADYEAGDSLATIAHRHNIDPQTVANRLRRAGHSIRPRRGWNT